VEHFYKHGKRRVTFVVLAVAIACSHAPASDCLAYEPSVVRLAGTVVQEVFPGPPNYEDVHRGDKPETIWLLVLSRPVCVKQDKKQSDLNPARTGVARIQMVLDQQRSRQYADLIGKRVVATGTLFGEHTGHHHTKVLLTVTTLARDWGQRSLRLHRDHYHAMRRYWRRKLPCELPHIFVLPQIAHRPADLIRIAEGVPVH
jgi:hypothetical protein